MFSGGFNPFYNLRNSPKEEEEKKVFDFLWVYDATPPSLRPDLGRWTRKGLCCKDYTRAYCAEEVRRVTPFYKGFPISERPFFPKGGSKGRREEQSWKVSSSSSCPSFYRTSQNKVRHPLQVTLCAIGFYNLCALRCYKVSLSFNAISFLLLLHPPVFFWRTQPPTDFIWPGSGHKTKRKHKLYCTGPAAFITLRPTPSSLLFPSPNQNAL